MTENPYSRALSAYSKFVAFCTFLLLIAGALVTSTGSGLAVPDWPLSFGQFFPKMEGGVIFEHGHRMIAGIVGLLAVGLALWLSIKEKRRWVRRLGWISIAGVVLQAVLGGVTVLLKLPDSISIAHASLAEIFFSCMLIIAIATSRAWNMMCRDSDQKMEGISWNRLYHLGLASYVVIYLQIIFGAVFRHSGQGLFIHVAWALVVALVVFAFVGSIISQGNLAPFYSRLAFVLVMLLLAQFILGAGTLVEKLQSLKLHQMLISKIILASIHLAVGALMLAVSLTLTMVCGRWARSHD